MPMPCLEPENDRTCGPHLTRGGSGSRAKPCPDSRNKRLGAQYVMGMGRNQPKLALMLSVTPPTKVPWEAAASGSLKEPGPRRGRRRVKRTTGETPNTKSMKNDDK